jgi:hypothetical protein
MNEYNHAARVREGYIAQQRETYRGKKAMGLVEMYEKTPRFLTAPKYSRLTGTFSDPRDDREMLMRLGSGEIGATLAIPYLPQTPRISDPDAQGVIMIIECIQRGLNRMGCDLRTDGFLGVQTTHCLKQVSGISWHEKSWLQLLGDVLGGLRAGVSLRPKNAAQAVGLGATELVIGTPVVQQTLQYKNIGGVCVGSNDYTRNLFADLQRQLNRVASIKGAGRITVDGKIGNQTVELANRVMDPSIWEQSFLEKVFGTKTGCDAIASSAVDIAVAARRYADAFGVAPAEVKREMSSPKKVAAAAPPASRSPVPIWLLGAAVLGGGYWYYTKKKRKTKKRKR